MNELFSRIEDFLFDILGLVLPGFVFLSFLIIPILFIDQKPNDGSANASIIAIYNLVNLARHEINVNGSIAVVTIFIFSYILGHFVKVFAIIMYDFLTTIFDKIINVIFVKLFLVTKLVINIIYKLFSNKDVYDNKIYKYLKTLSIPFKNTFWKIFIFKPLDYFPDNKELIDECVKIINTRLGSNYKNTWGYPLYKFARIMADQHNIKSLAGNFLAKYNLYRSLAFIFIFSLFYYSILLNHYKSYFVNEFGIGLSYIVFFFALLAFTFHYKYKRYWTLCGNETLVSLYCLLNKDKIIHEA